MKKNIYIVILFFYGNISADISNIVTNCAKFILPNSANWLEAGYYASVIYTDIYSAQNNLSNTHKQLNSDEISRIRSTLKKYNYEHAYSIKIACIDTHLRAYVQSAISCTHAKILINPDIYNKLSDQEKETAIVHALVRLENSHIVTHACTLALIPFCTELLLKAQEYSFSHIKTDSNVAQTAMHYINHITQFPVTKFCINVFLTHWYFKRQEKRFDLATVERLKNSNALAAFYEKTHTLIKDKSYLRSMRQPSLESRIRYLSAYTPI